MFAMILTTLLAIVPHDGLTCDEVDVIELNHYFDGQGRHVFDQLIFYDWDERAGRHQVRAWRIYKTPSQMPHFSERQGLYLLVWHDTQNGDCIRQVSAKSFRKTYTQYDPEVEERQKLARELRRELSRATKY